MRMELGGEEVKPRSALGKGGQTCERHSRPILGIVSINVRSGAYRMEGECAPGISGANETDEFGPLGDLPAICPWRNVPSSAAPNTCCNFGNKANGDIAQMTTNNSAGITLVGYGAFMTATAAHWECSGRRASPVHGAT